MTITVTNLSSRSFIFGEMMILPKIPQDITEDQKGLIDRSPYAEFFVYHITEDPPDTLGGGLRIDTSRQERE
jgi:hypothetical protein